NTLQIEADSGTQTRLLHFGAAPAELGQPSWQGYSVAGWQMAGGGRRGAAAGQTRTGTLRIVTTNMLAGYIRKNGVPYSANTLLTPVANPGKIVAAPVNYQKHLDEVRADVALHHHNPIAAIDRAGLFLKATSSLIGAGEAIRLRKGDRRTDHEVELAFVIGKE